LATGSTLNLQSFMGAIMAVGVAVANAILLVTFAERARREGRPAVAAAVEGARSRVRPILMTSAAMIAPMNDCKFSVEPVANSMRPTPTNTAGTDDTATSASRSDWK
jgi:multidrug efflux pump subunit AcrB